MTDGDRMKKARKAAGLTQIQVAQRAGIAVNSLRLYEAGKRQPRLDQLQRIAAALGVSVSDLLGQDKQEELSGLWWFVLEQKLKKVGYSIGFYEEDAYIWINYPDGTLEVTEADLKELDRSTDLFLRFELQELRNRRAEDFRPKWKQPPQPPQNAPESTPPARAGEDTTPPSDTPETPSDGDRAGKQ